MIFVTMVELAEAPYDQDGIPMVTAAIVCIDGELWDHTVVTAEAIPTSPASSITSPSATAIGREPPIPEYYGSESLSIHVSDDPSYRSENDQNTTISDEEHERQRRVGAGAAGAVMGLLVGGPVLSLFLGFGAAYYTRHEGATGDLARALGEVALVAKDKFQEIDNKHNLVHKSQEAAQEAIRRIQEADRRHHGQEKFFRFVRYSWETTLSFVERHRLVQRGYHHLQKLLAHIARKIHEHDRLHGHPCRHH